MTGAFPARDAHFDDSRLRVPCAERFVEQLDGDLGLFLQGFGEFRGAATGEIWRPIFIERLTDDDQFRSMLRGEFGNLSRVYET